MTEVTHARLDQWLWAARFYKTRSQAKAAIEGGKIRIDGARAKPSREVTIGMRLTISRDREEIDVVVNALGTRRGDAAHAASLYAQTRESAERRAAAAESRRLTRASYIAPPGRPNKRDRRALGRLKYGPADDA